MNKLAQKQLINSGLIAYVGGEIAFTPKGKQLKTKIENIIRKHLNLIDAKEVEFPLLIDCSDLNLDKKVLFGRYISSFRTSSKDGIEYILARTAEELAAKYFLKHKKDNTIYQIKTKFRDENKKELSVIKRREFTMMDAYSFDKNDKESKQTYQKMRQCFCDILQELNISFYIQSVKEGGTVSEEFISKKDEAELGHIYHLDGLYTKPYGLNNIVMGSYGLGIDRIMFAVALNDDDFEINVSDIGEAVGIDIEDIVYFRKRPYKNHKQFYNKIFTNKEISYCLSKQDPYPSFATRFCAKEAFIKAIKQPIKELKDIEISIDKNKPLIKYRNVKALLSMSHSNDKAIAIVSTKNNKRYVFLPGLGINHSFIGKLEKELGESVYFFELPGHGCKPINQKGTINVGDVAILLKEELEKNNIQNPILIGHSYGGFVALSYAMENPVEKIVLINTSPETVIKPDYLKFFKNLYKPKSTDTCFDFSKIRIKNDAEVSKIAYKSISSDIMMAYWKGVLKYNITKKLGKISCPVQIIAGENDSVIKKSFVEKFRKITDNIHYIRGGHYLPLTNYKEVTKLILK